MYKKVKLKTNLQGELVRKKIQSKSKCHYDITSLMTESHQYIFRASRYIKILIASLHQQNFTHNLYLAEEAKALIYFWPSGETLCIPWIGDTLLLHHHQHNWLQFYPFLANIQSDTAILDLSQFESINYQNLDPLYSYMMLGRDHWGHFVVDFMSRLLMVENNYQFISSKSALLLEMPRRKENVIQTLKTFSNLQTEIINLTTKRSQILTFNNVYITDNSPPLPFLAGQATKGKEKTHDFRDEYCLHKKNQLNIGFLHTDSNSKRISNYDELISFAHQRSFKIIDPVNCQNGQDSLLVYGDCDLIISPHGAAMLNPLIFTNKLIICLMPSMLFSEQAHICDIQQYSDITFLFGTRVIPCFGKPLKKISSNQTLPANFTINTPHTYCTEHLSEVLELISQGKKDELIIKAGSSLSA